MTRRRKERNEIKKRHDKQHIFNIVNAIKNPKKQSVLKIEQRAKMPLAPQDPSLSAFSFSAKRAFLCMHVSKEKERVYEEHRDLNALSHSAFLSQD